MAARVGPRGECGPCHGGLGGSRGGDACEPPLLFQPRQIGELACLEQPRNDAGVQTIQTNDDDLLDGSILTLELSAKSPLKRADP